MSDDDPSAVHRAHRAKRLRSVTGGVDGGAVAVGLVVPLALFAPTLVVDVPDWMVLTGLVVGLFLGGFLARSVSSPHAWCRCCHGAYVGAATATVIALVIIADSLASGETVVLEIRHIVGPNLTGHLVATAVAIGIAGIGGLVSSPRGA